MGDEEYCSELSLGERLLESRGSVLKLQAIIGCPTAV
jgi:hypothetical protein